MSRKYFVILGLFLAAGFLFLNTNAVNAATYTWTGGGDRVSWRDPANWNIGNGAMNYPGASTTDSVIIGMQTSGATGAGNVVIRATSTTDGSTLWLDSVTIGVANQGGPNVIIGNGITWSASTSVTLVGTSTLRLGDATWGSGNIKFANGSTNANPFLMNSTTTANFYAATGTVTFTGTGGTGSQIVIATTTYYNLTLTPTSTAAISTYKFGANGNTCSTTTGCTATTTVSNALTLSSYAHANFNSTAVVLSGSGTVFSKANTGGTFVANGSLVKYTNASVATNIATGTYDNLVISGASVTKTLLGNTTATSTVAIESGTLALTTSTFTVTGSTYTNSDTVTRTTGKIVKASASQFDNCSGTAKSTYNGDARDSVCVQVTDTSLNFTTSAETQTVTVTATSGLTDNETVTLTETGVATGIFRGGVQLNISGTDVADKLDYQGGGTLSLAYTDSQDSDDTGAGSGSFTGTAAGGGGGGGAATPATPAVPAIPAIPGETPAVPAIPGETPAVPATTVVLSLEVVQTKIASVLTKVAALTKNSPAADIAMVQAEIVAILLDIQAIQAAQPAPQGLALGFNFVRPLALGMTHNDVRNLQQALKTDSSVYPDGLVTGYFGPATLKAIKKFQEKYGIASPGDTGYGSVGPKTRAKLNELFK